MPCPTDRHIFNETQPLDWPQTPPSPPPAPTAEASDRHAGSRSAAIQLTIDRGPSMRNAAGYPNGVLISCLSSPSLRWAPSHIPSRFPVSCVHTYHQRKYCKCQVVRLLVCREENSYSKMRMSTDSRAFRDGDFHQLEAGETAKR